MENNISSCNQLQSPVYFRALAFFTGLDNINRIDTCIFSGPDPEIAFKYALNFINNRGGQLYGVYYDPYRSAIQKWHNGINYGIVFGNPALINY